jgi:phenylalanyl-tRNA synthetase alpha chain
MQELDQIIAEAGTAISSTATVADLEQAKARFLGKAGTLTALLKGLGKLA